VKWHLGLVLVVVKDTGAEWRHWCYNRSKGSDDTQHHRAD